MVGNGAGLPDVRGAVTRPILLPLLALTLALGAAAPASAAPDRPRWQWAVVVWATPDGTFRTRITDEASIERLVTATSDRVGIPNGRLVRGTAENRGHAWHLEDVEIVDMTIELCDGTARMVDDELDRWIAENGRYCPWDARVLRYRARRG